MPGPIPFRSQRTETEDAVCEPIADAGVPDGGVADGGVSDDASMSPDEQVGGDAGTDVSVEGGCGCAAAGAERGTSRAALALLGLALALALRRRRRSAR